MPMATIVSSEFHGNTSLLLLAEQGRDVLGQVLCRELFPCRRLGREQGIAVIIAEQKFGEAG